MGTRWLGGSAGYPRGRLPRPATPLLGREELVVAVVRAVRERRAVTLCGPDGIGATRLAIEVADRILAGGHSVGFVPVDGVPASELPAHVAARMGVATRGFASPLADVAAALGDTDHLLVLDRVEASDTLAEVLRALLDALPMVHVLLTSRSPVGLAGELVTDVDGLDAEAARALFVERATRATPELSAAVGADQAVARIARILEGSPLGIGLVTGWTRELGPAEVLARLRRLAAPGMAAGLAPIVHESWERLDPELRSVLARLSTFRSAFPLQAAARVAEATPAALLALVDRSLAEQHGGDFHLHPVVAEFAGRRLLDDSALAERTRRAHARHHLGLLVRARDLLADPDAGASTAESLHRVAPDLVAAWDHLLAAGDPRALVAAVGAVARLGERRAGTCWSRVLLERALERMRVPQASEDAWDCLLLASLHAASGELAELDGDLTAADRHRTAAELQLSASRWRPRNAAPSTPHPLDLDREQARVRASIEPG